MVFGGAGTTSLGLSLLLYTLASNQMLKQKCSYREITDGKSWEDVSLSKQYQVTIEVTIVSLSQGICGF